MGVVFPDWSTVEEDWATLLKDEGKQNLEDALLEAAWLPFPNKNFELGLSTRCNFNCPICYNHDSKFYGYYPGISIPQKTLRAFITRHSPWQNFVFAVTGEPLLYPNILNWLKFTARHAATLNLSTNGSLLSRDIADFLSTCPVNFVHISIDGAGQDYGRFRKGGSLQRFKENVSYLAQRLQDKVFFAATVFNQNREALLLLPGLAAELGVRHIHFFALNLHPKMKDRSIRNLTTKELRNFLPRLLDKCQKAGITPHWTSTFAQASLHHQLIRQGIFRQGSARKQPLDPEQIGAQYREICFLPFERINVDPLGQINFCCQLEFIPAGNTVQGHYLSQSANSEDRQIMSKNVFETGLEPWWNCRLIRIMRVMNITRRFPRVCVQRCHKIRQDDVPLDPPTIWQLLDRFRKQTAEYLNSRSRGKES